jgi:branched-chain amino acid transport system ATP-binding protein
MTLLRVEGLCAAYGHLPALTEIDLSVEPGETLAVVGANGAGKSTLLRTITGLMPASAGRVLLDGNDITALPAHRRVRAGVALVPEGRRLFPTLTVQENLQVGAQSGRPGPWSLDAVYEAFPLLAERASQRASTLSGGQQQTVAIGRGLMANPMLLLLDEVSLGLAPIVIRQVYAALPKISAAGTTVLVVEQDLGQALSVADTVACLLEGRVVLGGPVADLDRAQVAAAYFGQHSPAAITGGAA